MPHLDSGDSEREPDATPKSVARLDVAGREALFTTVMERMQRIAVRYAIGQIYRRFQDETNDAAED